MSDLVISVVPSVELVNGQPMVSSLTVAEHFRKAHKNVLRDIKVLDCSPRFAESNFGLSEYVDRSGRPLQAIRMTRDGFMFLVMGYTGAAAARVKEAYIQRFNELEARLQVRAADLQHYRRCERDLIRVQRYSLALQRRVIRLQGRMLATPRPASSPQADLFTGAAA